METRRGRLIEHDVSEQRENFWVGDKLNELQIVPDAAVQHCPQSPPLHVHWLTPHSNYLMRPLTAAMSIFS